MNKQEVFEMINALSEKLGVAVEYLMGVMVKQAYVTGAYNLFVIALCFGVMFILSFTATKVKHKGDKEALVIFSAIGLLISIGVTLHLAHETFTAFINPEYWIFMELKK